MSGSDGIVIEQALLVRNGPNESRLVGRSAGFTDEWISEATRMCAEFGERPKDVACPQAVFVRPFGDGRVAVVQVADVGDVRPLGSGPLGFRFLVVPRDVYFHRIGDPFAIAERFPPAWHLRGDLPVLDWPAEPLPPREIAEVQRILQRVTGPNASPLSPVLLGATQALVDGGRVVFERPAPDTELVRDLWQLLPHSTRHRLWPATFAFAPQFDFDVVVVPNAADEQFTNYLTEEQAANYPQGRYELRLQLAAEAGDQREIDVLFARRSRADMFRIGFVLLIGMIALLGVSKVLQWVMR